MKWFFLLLLVSNVGYFAWEFDKDVKIARLAQPDRQIVAKGLPKLKVLDENSTYPVQRHTNKKQDVNSSPVDVANSQAARDTNTLSQLGFSESLLGIANNPNLRLQEQSKSCFRIGPFSQEPEREMIVAWSRKRNIEAFKHKTVDTSKHLYWVTISPSSDISAASEKYQELKSKGIQDIMIIREGDLTNAISLGIYSTQAAVNRRLLEVKSKGYQAVVVPRYNEYFEWLDIRLNSVAKEELDFDVNPFLGKKYQEIECNEIALVERNP